MVRCGLFLVQFGLIIENKSGIMRRSSQLLLSTEESMILLAFQNAVEVHKIKIALFTSYLSSNKTFDCIQLSMSVIKDVDHTLQQTTKIRSLHEHKLDSESSNKLAQNIKSYSYSAAVEAVNSMNRELKDLYEKYLELGVRSHLLEVDLATQFSPDLVIAVEELNESCAACSLAVENLTHCSESAEMLDETCQDNNVCEDN